MADTAKLQLKINSTEAVTASNNLDTLAKKGANAERATDGLTSSFKALVGPLVASVSAVATLTKTVEVTREFGKLNAQLKTATGSADNAAIAFGAIENFAKETPFQLQTAVQAFVKLKNLGLDPSEVALRSYGNTASAMGKSLDQFIEAVADASTSEFERLKEFGIRASKQGENVAFTFKGVTTTVKNSSADIERYLQDLGTNNFGDAMSDQMATLDGAMSNLQDQWDSLFRTVSSLGTGDVIESTVRLAIDAIALLDDALATGALVEYLSAVANKFEGFSADIIASINSLSVAFGITQRDAEVAFGGMVFASAESAKFITGAFANLPENLRAIIQLMGAEVAAIVDYAKIYGSAFGDVLGIEFAKIVQKAQLMGAQIADAINPFNEAGVDYEAGFARLDSLATEQVTMALDGAARRIEANRAARSSSIRFIIEERDTALASYDAQISKAKELLNLDNGAGQDTDVLSQFQTEVVESDALTPAQLAAQKASAKAFERLQLDLLSEEDAIKSSYEKRLQIVLDNTAEGGALRYELETKLATERNDQLHAIETARIENTLSQTQSAFGFMAAIAKRAKGEQSKEYKAMFAVSQAFAIAQAGMKTYESAQSAYAALAPIPYIGPALGIAAAGAAITAGLANVAQIRGQNFAGAFDNGGVIPQGQFGLVGEIGPEIVQGPANVTSRKETAKLLSDRGDGGSANISQPQNIKIINLFDVSVISDYLSTEEGEEMIMNVVKNNPELLQQVASA